MKRETVLELELSAPNPVDTGSYYTELSLPAEEHEIRDALQRIRVPEQGAGADLEICASPYLPELAELCLDAPSIRELDLLARRLLALRGQERTALSAVIEKTLEREGEDTPLRVKDLINSTYGLDRVPVCPGITTLEELGAFVLENGMNEEAELVPGPARYLLDLKELGRIQMRTDGGVFVSGCYVAAGTYERPELYDGITLPGEEQAGPSGDWVFRLRIAGAGADDGAEWMELPIDREEADLAARRCNAERITDCICRGFVSSVPQITAALFRDMGAFDRLNALAYRLADMPEEEQVRLKAVLCAGRPADLDGAAALMENLSQYEVSIYPESGSQFLKEYLRHHLDGQMDSGWLTGFRAWERNGEELLHRLGAVCTPYGVVSAPDRSLFEPVACREKEEVRQAEAGEGVSRGLWEMRL